MSRFGLQMYTVRDYMKNEEDLKSTLKKVSEIGYDNVQISIPPYIKAEKLQGYLYAYNLCADSVLITIEDIAKDKVHSSQYAARCGEIFKTDVVRTTSIPVSMRTEKEGYIQFAKDLNEYGKTFCERGLRFMYHFHAFEYVSFGDITGMDILLSQTDPKYVYFQPDVYWLASAGKEPSKELYDFKGRAFYMHLKDYAMAMPEGVIENVNKVSCPVGKGNLNWDGIFAAAKDIGIENYVAEDDMGMLPPFESAKQSFEYLSKRPELQS